MGQVLSAFGWFLSVVFKNLSNVFSIEEGQAKRGLTGRGAPTSQKHQTFGLVIGIDKYKFIKPNQDLRGAVQDADDFESYLVNDRDVPKANIITLRNEEATRSAIIDGFRQLKDDSKIIPGEVAIIIYFAGHGTTALKPTTWTNWEAPGDKVELLCPADINHDINGKDKVEGIPDRTLTQLLMELSNAKGDNITLILDCCHAAGMNRGANDPARRSRTLYFKNVQDLSPTCDEHIYSRESRTRSFQDRESGFSGSYLGSHILLAACGRTQTAWEEGDNGLFTTALLRSLKDAASRDLPPTYDSLMKSLPKLENQTPHWDGKHVHRFIFDSWRVPAGCSAIPCYRGSDDWPDDLILQAGSLHGITVGSTFEIFRSPFSHPNMEDLVTVLEVAEVKQAISRLLPTSSESAGSALNSGFWYARLRKASDDFPLYIYCNDPDTLDRILADSFESILTAHVDRVENPDDADILLTVKENMVHFSQGKRANARIKFSYFPLYSPRPVLAMPDIRDFINRYAHFTSRLIIESPHATTDFVTIAMNKLRYDTTDRELKVDKQVAEDGKPFEIVVKTRMEDQDPYGFTIRHKGGVGMYAHLLYFDASKLIIEAWYRPQMGQTNQGASVDPCLMNNSTLTLGYGRVGMNPISFDVPAGQNADVCFIKIIVATKAVEIGPIEQFESPPDVKSRNAFRWTPPPSDLEWTSKTFTIVSKHSQGVVSQAKENALPKNEESDLV